MSEFLTQGYLIYPSHLFHEHKLLQKIYKYDSLKMETSFVVGSTDIVYDPENPYTSSQYLGLHTEGLGESRHDTILGLGIEIQEKPIHGGRSVIVSSYDILRELPGWIKQLHYEFLHEGNIYTYPLVRQHPIYKLPCINFIEPIVNNSIDSSASCIHFPGHDSIAILKDIDILIKKHRKFIEIPENSMLYVDNFLALHGREEFSGKRTMKRYTYLL